jgi:hypothetical protein
MFENFQKFSLCHVLFKLKSHIDLLQKPKDTRNFHYNTLRIYDNHDSDDDNNNSNDVVNINTFKITM